MKRITVITGSEFAASGERIADATRAYASILADAIAKFGGASAVIQSGTWRNDAGEVVSEYGRQFIILTDDGKAERHAIAFAEFVKLALRQSSVILIIDDVKVRFV